MTSDKHTKATAEPTPVPDEPATPNNTPEKAPEKTAPESPEDRRARLLAELQELDQTAPEADSREPDKTILLANGDAIDIAGAVPTHHHVKGIGNVPVTGVIHKEG